MNKSSFIIFQLLLFFTTSIIVYDFDQIQTTSITAYGNYNIAQYSNGNYIVIYGDKKIGIFDNNFVSLASMTLTTQFYYLNIYENVTNP